MKGLLIFVFIFLSTNSAFSKSGTPWVVSSDIKNLLDTQSLKSQFPKIKNATDLSQLLKSVHDQQPFLRLEAHYFDGYWVLEGDPAWKITNVKFFPITRKMNQSLKPIRDDFIGEVDNSEVRYRILSHARNKLAQHGYTNSILNFRVDKKNHEIEYLIDIDEGAPCLIQNIQLPFKLPRYIKINLDYNQICSVQDIKKQIDLVEEQLKDHGFNKAQLKLKRINYNADQTRCDIQVEGDLDYKYQHNLEVVGKSNIGSYLYQSINFNDLQNFSSDPETIREEIIKRFQNNGYEDVYVDQPIIKKLDDELIEYRYLIRPGVAYLIDEIQVDGNFFFEREKILEILGFASTWSISPPLSRDDISDNIEKLLRLYYFNGFWDAKILPPRITKNKADETAQVLIIIKENKRRRLNKLSFKGNTVFTQNELYALSKIKIADPINKQDLLKIEEKLLEKYIRHGYLYAQIKIKTENYIQGNDILVSVLYEIDEGIRVKVGAIKINGLIKTNFQVVRRQLQFKTGDWYNPEKLANTRKNLINLGIFSAVKISSTEKSNRIEKPNVLNVTIDLKESNSGSISFGPGYNLDRGLFYVGEANFNNVRGNQSQLSLKASISEERNQETINNEKDSVGKLFLGRKLGAGFIQPYLFSKPIDGRVSLSHLGIAENIWKISNKIELSLSHKFSLFNAKNELVGFYYLQRSRDEGSQVQEDALVATGNSSIGATGFRISNDTRNSLAWPSDGSLFILELSSAKYLLGGNYNFNKIELRYSRYLNIFQNLVLALGFSTTTYESVSRKSSSKEQNTVLPSTERLLAKGVNLVRGFQEELGPWVEINGEKNTLGGSRRAILKLELRYRYSATIGFSGFLDSGNTFLSRSEMRKFAKQFENVENHPNVEDNIGYTYDELFRKPGFLYSRHFIGSGLSSAYLTPIGPLQLTLAWPVKEPKSLRCKELGICFLRSKNESKWFRKVQTYISVGAEF